MPKKHLSLIHHASFSRSFFSRFAFIANAGIGLILNSTIIYTLTVSGMHYLSAQVIATAGVLLWSFIVNSLWTFRSSNEIRMTLSGEPSRNDSKYH